MNSVQISQAARSKLKLWRNGIQFGERIKTIRGGFMRNFGRKGEAGKIGYIILWLLGVPFGVLCLIFLLRGCH